jgi:hypothetical protein
LLKTNNIRAIWLHQGYDWKGSKKLLTTSHMHATRLKLVSFKKESPHHRQSPQRVSIKLKLKKRLLFSFNQRKNHTKSKIM